MFRRCPASSQAGVRLVFGVPPDSWRCHGWCSCWCRDWCPIVSPPVSCVMSRCVPTGVSSFPPGWCAVVRSFPESVPTGVATLNCWGPGWCRVCRRCPADVMGAIPAGGRSVSWLASRRYPASSLADGRLLSQLVFRLVSHRSTPVSRVSRLVSGLVSPRCFFTPRSK